MNCSVCSVCMAGHGLTICKGPVSCLDRRHMDGSNYMINRCVEMCTRFLCSGHCCSHHKLRFGFSVIRLSSSLCAVAKGRSGTVVRKVGHSRGTASVVY